MYTNLTTLFNINQVKHLLKYKVELFSQKQNELFSKNLKRSVSDSENETEMPGNRAQRDWKEPIEIAALLRKHLLS